MSTAIRSTGVKYTTLTDGRLSLKGNTFPYKETIKQVGGKWTPDTNAWVLPAGTDLSFIKPIPQEPIVPWFACCEKAKIIYFGRQEYICKEHDHRPWWLCCDKARIVSVANMSCSCAAHGSPMSDMRVRGAIYTGD